MRSLDESSDTHSAVDEGQDGTDVVAHDDSGDESTLPGGSLS